MNTPSGVSIEFNLHSNASPRGYRTVESLTRAVEEAYALWRERNGPIIVVIDLVVMRYGRIMSQRSVYFFQRNKAP